MTLVLEHGLRPDRSAAEALVASSHLKSLALADYQQRIEALRMFGCALAGVPIVAFRREIKTTLVPRLTYIAEHACADSPRCMPTSRHSMSGCLLPLVCDRGMAMQRRYRLVIDRYASDA